MLSTRYFIIYSIIRINRCHQGPIADSLIRKIRSTGGIMTHSDLQNYRVKVDRALEGTYLSKKVYTSHAPTSGPGEWLRTISVSLTNHDHSPHTHA